MPFGFHVVNKPKTNKSFDPVFSEGQDITVNTHSFRLKFRSKKTLQSSKEGSEISTSKTFN